MVQHQSEHIIVRERRVLLGWGTSQLPITLRYLGSQVVKLFAKEVVLFFETNFIMLQLETFSISSCREGCFHVWVFFFTNSYCLFKTKVDSLLYYMVLYYV